MHIRVLTFVLALLAPTAAAHVADKPVSPAAYTCAPGITAAERQFALPAQLLHTIAIVESGRLDPVTGRITPWPWTINVDGIGHFYETKAAAIEAVRELQAAGVHSIDVGCMQINLTHHPDAFASLEEAFDPRSNTTYGARFLSALYHETHSWPRAAAAYHSRTQDLGAAYATRVMAIWPLAGRFADPAPGLRNQVMAPPLNLSNYTSEFAAEVRQMRANAARLATMSAPLAPPHTRFVAVARPGDRGYTPELVSAWRRRPAPPASPRSRYRGRTAAASSGSPAGAADSATPAWPACKATPGR